MREEAENWGRDGAALPAFTWLSFGAAMAVGTTKRTGCIATRPLENISACRTPGTSGGIPLPSGFRMPGGAAPLRNFTHGIPNVEMHVDAPER